MKNCLKYCLKMLCLCLIATQPIKLFSDEKPFIIMNNPVNSGFGAVFSAVLSALDLYDQGHYAGLQLDLNSGVYVDPQKGPNWWEYFFEPVYLGNDQAPHHVLTSDEVSILINAGFPMSRERSFELIQKYIHLKPAIQKKINKLVKINFSDFYMIGIHHRGTDKCLETSIVPYSTTLFHVDWLLANLPKDKKVRIFVATDDQNFLNHVRKLYPGQVVYNDFVRSKNDSPIHYNDCLYKNNYQKGKEALIDCLLLSKCDFLLFPAASAFSMLSVKFNPYLTAIPLANP